MYVKGKKLDYIGKLNNINRKIEWTLTGPFNLQLIKFESDNKYRARLLDSLKSIGRM